MLSIKLRRMQQKIQLSTVLWPGMGRSQQICQASRESHPIGAAAAAEVNRQSEQDGGHLHYGRKDQAVRVQRDRRSDYRAGCRHQGQHDYAGSRADIHRKRRHIHRRYRIQFIQFKHNFEVQVQMSETIKTIMFGAQTAKQFPSTGHKYQNVT